MTVYVDDFKTAYGNMRMSHMLADSDDELHAMADQIGVARRWHQNGMSGSHYDIAQSKVALAIKAGAVAVTVRQMAMMSRNRRRTGVLGAPDPYYGTGYDPSKERVVLSFEGQEITLSAGVTP